MKNYLFRRGDGNEGNYPRYVVTLKDNDDAYAAIAALLASEYEVSRVRRYIVRNVDVDGEPEYGLHATVYEGPKGERAFEAAWLTAELQPLETEKDVEFWTDRATPHYGLWEALDTAARRQYNKAKRRA